jgi:hypothetical protein
MIKRTTFLPLLLLGTALAFAQPAAATDYCVDVPSTCDPTNNLPHFEDALNKADDAPDADRIFLGAGTYTAPSAAGFSYLGGPVEVIGKGQGTTILTNSTFGAQRVLSLIGAAGTSVHDLTVHIPAGVTTGHKGLATNGTAREIQVTESSGQLTSLVGVALFNGAVLEDSSVELNKTDDTAGVVLDSGGGTVRNSIVIGRTAVESHWGGTLDRVRASGLNNGVIALADITTIKSSLIRVTGQFATGLSAVLMSNANSQVRLDGVALDGPGTAGSTGVGAGNFLAPSNSVQITIKNSIIRRFDKAINMLGFGGSGLVQTTASYSDYDVSKAKWSGTGAGITQVGITNVGDAGFANPATGNYHLLPGSPLVDAGDPATPQGLDMDGKALVTDGDGDGTARRDVGPFELPTPVSQTPPPPPPAGGSDPAPSGGSTPPPADTGTSSTAAHATGLEATGVVSVPRDTQPPLITGFRTTSKVFAVGRARTAISARVRGTRFRYTLSENAKVTVTILRRNGKSAGKLTRSGKKGANTLKFSGRIGRKALKHGGYGAVITATDAAGNRSAPRSVKFRVV